MATPALMTVEEFCQMGTADTEAYELVDGVLVALPSPSLLHGIIKDEVITQMNMYFRQNPLGGGVSETTAKSVEGQYGGLITPYFWGNAGKN